MHEFSGSFQNEGAVPMKIKYERNLGKFDRVLRAGVSFLMIYYVASSAII